LILPKELARREPRLAAIARAGTILKAQAMERFARERAAVK